MGNAGRINQETMKNDGGEPFLLEKRKGSPHLSKRKPEMPALRAGEKKQAAQCAAFTGFL